MPSLNTALLIGHAGADPDVRTTASGRRVVTFSLATSRRWGASGGAVREKTEWHRIVVWDELAAVVSRGVRRGARVFVEGRLEYRSWQDRSGRTRYATEIIAQELILLDPPRSGGSRADEDDLPF